MAAELIRGLVTELVRGLGQDIVSLVMGRLSSVERQSAKKTEVLFHSELEIAPDKKHQH